MFAKSHWRVPVRANAASLLGFVCFTLVLASSSPAQDKGASPWGEFLKRFGRDKLLKPPFAMADEGTPKGLASKIRARELDVPNRIKALEYLSELDCKQFPEAQEMLITAMHEDRWERVRLAAAKGLRDMLERGACNPCQQDEKNAGQDIYEKSKFRKGEKRFYPAACHCRNCCTEDVLNALAKTAYEMNENGCPFEPSLRVREMAVEAISVCGIPCCYKPYYATSEPEPAPPEEPPQVDPEKTGATPETEGNNEAAPTEESKGALLPPPPRVTVTQPPVKIQVAPTPIDQLDKICIVSWRQGEKRQPSHDFESIYKGRIYHFADAQAKATFDDSPEDFAVAYGGCDPVHYVKTREAKVGRFLADIDGKFYLFATMENLEEFNDNPETFSRDKKRVRVVSTN